MCGYFHFSNVHDKKRKSFSITTNTVVFKFVFKAVVPEKKERAENTSGGSTTSNRVDNLNFG